MSTDYEEPIIRGGIEYLLTEDDILNLHLEKNIYESTYTNMNYYDAQFISLTYHHIFDPKIAGRLFGTYQKNEYPEESTEGTVTKEREDKFFGWGGALRYYIREWLSTEGRYEFIERDSNFTDFDYEVHLWTLRVSAGF